MARMSIRTKLAAAAATGALALGAGLLAAGPAQAAWSDCPLGYVCIYATTSENSPIVWKEDSAGWHNLSGMYGNHRIFNNQTDGWRFWTCTGYDGAGCSSGYLPAGHYMDKNLTPINSVRIGP
ncbi:hypothetical protein ACWEPM_26510 [Streptomyces sp. NPDC004244]